MSVSKSLRFEIFKRDGFTCQYCGMRPPEAVLELDHIEPRAHGGLDEESNLITSCWDCNRGKSDKQLGHVRPWPDADLAYLGVQQEIAEARRYQQSLAAREQALTDTVEVLTNLWNLLTEDLLDWHPHPRVLRQFLAKYPPEIVEAALRDVAPKVASNWLKAKWVPYTWSVMRNMVEVAE